MKNNSTFSYQDICSSKINQSPVLSLSTSVIVLVLSPVAVAGNTLILAAIWRNPSLRTPSHILLCGLAFTDLCTGLITQPLYIALVLICFPKKEGNNSPSLNIHVVFYMMSGSGFYFTCLTAILIASISFERWLHMNQRSFLTVRRSCYIVAVVSLLLIPIVLNLYFSAQFAFNVIIFVVLLFCLIFTPIAYFNIFKIIRRHQQQVDAHASSQNLNQPAIDLLKYRKSVFSILYILGLFYISYVPFLIVKGLFILISHVNNDLNGGYIITMTLMFLSSSCNPLIYIWRMSEIRNEVKKLLKKVICMQ